MLSNALVHMPTAWVWARVRFSEEVSEALAVRAAHKRAHARAL
jgi:hypothetical protein